MQNAIIMTSYKLKEGVSVPDFILAADKFHSEFAFGQKGLVSFKLLANEEMWADYSVWETMDDFKNAEPQTKEAVAAMNAYFSFIDAESAVDLHFHVEKEY